MAHLFTSKKFLLILIALLCAGSFASARKIKSKVAGTPAPVATSSVPRGMQLMQLDSVPQDSIAVRFSGFDKPTTSYKESFFITNDYPHNIHSLKVEIKYFTPDGRLLHTRTANIRESIPAGQTRNVTISSWDRQKSFHYFRSHESHNGSSPFTVAIRPISILFKTTK